MVAAMTETDIDQFIREQKNKLQKERSSFEENEMTIPQLESPARKNFSRQELNIERLERQLNELRAMSVSAGEKLNSQRQTTQQPEPPPKPVTKNTTESVDFFSKFGEYDKKKKKLRAELENDYQKHLAGANLRRYGNPKGPVDNTASHPGIGSSLSLDVFGVEKPPLRNRLKAIENTESSEPSKHIKWVNGPHERSRDEPSTSRQYQPTLNEEIESRLRRNQSPLLAVSNNLLDDPLWDELREVPHPLDSKISPLPQSHPLPTLPATNISEIFAANKGTEQFQHKSPINSGTPTRSRYPPRKTEDTYATLPLGTERKSARQRQKQSYREELQRQIDEKNAAKLEEKQLSKKIYEPLLPFGQAKKETQSATKDILQDYRSPLLDSQHPQLSGRLTGNDNQQLMSRSISTLPLNNHVPPLPPSLLYEPSGLLQDGGSSSIDDAYRFYGIKDHFDNSVTTGFEPSFLGNRTEELETKAQPKKNFSNVTNSKENFGTRPGALVFGESDNNKNSSRTKEQVYLKALERQIEEKKALKLKEKRDQENYEKTLEEESRNYNPFGRGGGGAPLKDSSGNVLANLRQIKRDLMNEDPTARISQITSAPLQEVSNFGLPSNEVTAGPLSNLNNPLMETSHARGGHGIFGQPKTDAQKSAMDQYRDELQKQIMEKRNRKLAELELQKQEEDKVNKRLEDDRKKMQEEFEQEVKKKKAKAEEERRREEEMKQLLESKKAAAEKQVKDAEERRERERRERERKLEEEQQQQQHQQSSQRPKSPPVPALHRKIKSNNSKQNSPRDSVNSARPGSARTSTSRPDSAVQSTKISGSSPSRHPKEAPRAQSADVLNQLKVLKKGLHQKLLENDLRDATGYDASSGILGGKESAPINQKAVLLRRGSHHVGDSPAMVNSDVLKDFNQLKYRGGSASRSVFRSRFPDPPSDVSSLELQQREMIKQQEETLRKIRANGGYKYNYENGHPPLLRQKTVSPFPMLDSKSAFYDTDHMAPLTHIFPDDNLNKNESARSRRRHHLHSPQLTPLDNRSIRSNSATSFASLNPETLAARNEERLKKLQNMSDAISLTEPEEILDKFMLKQQRKPSTPNSIF
ncbi:centrosome and spindle pole-associated protein 1-like isoform X3 [Octopus sinensis]|uniref:Centrosome and spindle pole-associated protein 1-like isoform X3 n=1 Tax=Octopus sinensis TaxID=2607531 RepID=A0A7E6F3D8_9MOLL|nr:centrosome and spindle pole-associated protein 1-like isoform X3 [Octopus sinensis]